MNERPLDFIAILDFEATCDKGKKGPKPQEIIEFPTVLFDNRSLEVVAEFSAFVRPVHHPTLTPFCTELTSIVQRDVDTARPFPEVWTEHTRWLEGQGLSVNAPGEGPSWALLTCGDWDLATMLSTQLAASQIDEVPLAYRRWINVKRPFARWAKAKKGPGMAGMLKALGLELKGRHHRGIDDCRNIARIVRTLRQAGESMQITSELAISRYPSLRLVLVGPGGTKHPLVLTKRAIRTLRGGVSGAFRCNPRRMTLADGAALREDSDLLGLRQDSEVYVAF